MSLINKLLRGVAGASTGEQSLRKKRAKRDEKLRAAKQVARELEPEPASQEAYRDDPASKAMMMAIMGLSEEEFANLKWEKRGSAEA